MFYIGSMETNRNGQSLESQAIDELPPEKVAEWLKKDINVACALLNALRSDQDLLIQMATFLQGRYMNVKNQEKLKNEGLE